MQTAIYTPTQVSDLLDVDVTGIAQGDVLVWDGTKFSPQPILGGGITFADIGGTISFDQFPPGSVATLDSIGEDALFFFDELTGLPKLISSAEAADFVGLSLTFGDVSGQISLDQLPTGSVVTVDTIGEDALYFFNETTGLPELISASDAATFVGLPLSFFDITGTISIDQFPAGTVTTLDSIDEDGFYFFNNTLFVPELIGKDTALAFLLPDQTGNDGFFLKTNAGALSWAAASGGGSGSTYTKEVRVDASGNDGTGTIGDLDKPFLTIQAALTALEDALVDGALILVGTNNGSEDLTTSIHAISFRGNNVPSLCNSLTLTGTNHALGFYCCGVDDYINTPNLSAFGVLNIFVSEGSYLTDISATGGNIYIYSAGDSVIQGTISTPSNLILLSGNFTHDTNNITIDSAGSTVNAHNARITTVTAAGTLNLYDSRVSGTNSASTTVYHDILLAGDDTAYDATSWDGNIRTPTKNAIRDKFEGLSSVYQPLDGDLSAVAALTTDSFGLALLTKTSASNVRSYIGAGTSSFSGAFSALSGIPTTLSGYGITDAQPLDGDLTTLAGLTATTDNFIVSVSSAWASRTPAQVLTTLAAVGTTFQPLDGDLTTIAGLAATTNNFIVSVSSAWASRTPTQVKTTLAIANTDVSGLGTLSTQNGTFSGTSSGTNTGDQTISLTGDVTGSGIGSFAATIATGAVTDAKGSLLVKPAVAVVAASNVTLSGEQTIDGQLTAGSLVLATNQSTGSQNGPWVSAAGAWTRPTWYTSGSTTQAPQFLTTFIRLGTTYQGSMWRMTTASVTIDTTSTTWVQTPTNINSVTGSLALSSLTASTSLSLGVGTIELGHASDTTIARSGAGAITVEGTQVLLSGAALGTPASGTLTNCTGLPIAGLTASTSTALGVGSVELGHASDTTLARVSAGVVSIEGSNIIMASNLASNVLTFLGTPSSANLRSAMTDEIGTGACVFDGATLTLLLTTATCGSSLASLNIPAGTVPTTPNDGDIFADANCLYGCTDAGNPGVIPIVHFIRADSTVTYANDTNSHAIFTTPTNGRLTVETGLYYFEGLFGFTSMSATSGNLLIDFLGAGTATCTGILWKSVGQDGAAGAALAQGGMWTNATASSAAIVTAGTATAMGVWVSGTFRVTVAGTLIPSLTQATASASVLSVGSYMMFRRMGTTTVTSIGQWD